jgi:hypothetical protein
MLPVPDDNSGFLDESGLERNVVLVADIGGGC